MSKGLCRLSALLISLILCLSAVTPVLAATHVTQSSKISGFTYSAHYGEKLNQILQGKAKLFSNSSDQYALGQKINMNKQYAVAKVISGQQCYIYAQGVYHYLFGDVPYHGSGIGDYWNNSKKVISNVKTVSCQSFTKAGVGFGAYIRTTINSNGSFSGSGGHSMIVLAYDDSGITYLDCNGDGKGMIRVTTRTWSEFNSVLLTSKGRRIAHVVQPNAPSADTLPKADLGTDFIAQIRGSATGKPLENTCKAGSSSQIRIVSETGAADQLWYFSRQTDGSYLISSCQNGAYLEVRNASKDTNAVIGTGAHTGSNDARKWYIHELNGKYVLRSKLSNLVISLTGNDSSAGSCLRTARWSGADAQLWTIQRSAALKKATLSVQAGDDASATVFTWNAVTGVRDYSLRILQSGEEYALLTNVSSGYGLVLPAGTYQAHVEARHHYDETISNAVTFTVEGHTHEITDHVTDPSCTDQGYTTYACMTCDHVSQDNFTDALGHHYIYQVAKAPTFYAGGTLTGSCSRDPATDELELPMLNTVDYDYRVIQEPTATEDGLGRYTWKDTSLGTYDFDVSLEKLPSDGSPLPGDVNGDGSVNSLDLILLRQYLAGWEVTCSTGTADVNGSGTVNSLDLILLRQHLAGWDVSLGNG